MGTPDTPAWEVEARKRLAEIPDLMKNVAQERADLNASAQECTRILESLRGEQRRITRVLGDASDGNGEEGEADARDAR